jgi:hypothetical protein
VIPTAGVTGCDSKDRKERGPLMCTALGRLRNLFDVTPVIPIRGEARRIVWTSLRSIGAPK